VGLLNFRIYRLIAHDALHDLYKCITWHEDRTWAVYQEDFWEKEGQGIPERKSFLFDTWRHSIDSLFTAVERLEWLEELEADTVV